MYTVNDAIRQLSVSDLASCKGVGVVTAMLVKRCGAKRPYVSFDDMIARVTGLGKKNSVELITRLKAYVKAKNAKTEAKPQPATPTYEGRCYGVFAKRRSDGKRFLVAATASVYNGPSQAHEKARSQLQDYTQSFPDYVWSLSRVSSELVDRLDAANRAIPVTARA